MNPTIQKVLERLNYEKVLLTAGMQPRRVRITLNDVFFAAEEEPRIYEVLPAIIAHRPQIISGYARDKKKYPLLEKIMKDFPFLERLPATFYGVDMKDCLKVAHHYRRFLNEREGGRKSRTLTLRLGTEDLARLRRLTQKLHTRGVSETIRLLAKEKESVLSA